MSMAYPVVIFRLFDRTTRRYFRGTVVNDCFDLHDWLRQQDRPNCIHKLEPGFTDCGLEYIEAIIGGLIRQANRNGYYAGRETERANAWFRNRTAVTVGNFTLICGIAVDQPSLFALNAPQTDLPEGRLVQEVMYRASVFGARSADGVFDADLLAD